MWLYVAIGALFLLWFFLHVRSSEKKGKDVLLPLRLFRNKVANLGLGTQTIQWLILQGSFFTVSVYLQEVNHYSPIQTGLMLTPATVGILAASAAAGRFARRHPQRWLIIAGFLVTAVGMILLLVLVRAHAGIWRWIPGLLLFGAGVGTMLTSSVNVVQSSFPDKDQGEISGLSRSVSNLGSSFGTALVGSVLVAVKLPEGRPFAVALAIMLVVALIGLVLAVLIPRQQARSAATAILGGGTGARGRGARARNAGRPGHLAVRLPASALSSAVTCPCPRGGDDPSGHGADGGLRSGYVLGGGGGAPRLTWDLRVARGRVCHAGGTQPDDR